MKAERILLLIFMFLNPTALCQFRAGVKAGLNYTNIINNNDAGEDLGNHYKFGFHGGVEFQIPIEREFYLKSGLLFTTKGSKDYYEVEGQTISLSYLELPVQIILKLPTISGKLYGGVGFYFSYAMSGYIEYAGGREKLRFRSKISEQDPFVYNPLDIGPEIVAGYEFHNGLTTQIGVQFGFSNLAPKSGGTSQNFTNKNSSVALSVGYRL